MTHLRAIHALAVLLCGAAVAFANLGLQRAALCTIALVLCLFAWSLETLRTAVLAARKEPKR